MNEVIKRRLLTLKHYNVTLDNIDENTEIISKIGYYRISQIVKRVHKVEPMRKMMLSELIAIFYKEQSLRKELNSMITHIELMLRTQFTERYHTWFGTFGYQQQSHFENQKLHAILMRKIAKQVDMKSIYEFIDDFRMRTFEELPIWMAAEMSTFHMLTLFFDILPLEKKQEIASYFGKDAAIFGTWLDFILVVRNACAHQGLLFSRKFERFVLLPENYHADIAGAVYVLNDLMRFTHLLSEDEVINLDKAKMLLSGFEEYYGFE